MTVFDFEPGDRIINRDVPIPGVVIDDDATPPGLVAVVYRDDVCSGVWYVRPEWIELVVKAGAGAEDACLNRINSRKEH